MSALNDRISVPLREAAALTGLSERTITNAHDRGDLIAYWAGNKRLFEVEELRAWVRSLPTTKPTR